MAARIQNATSQPDVTAGVQHLFKAVYAGDVPPQTLELVHLRASQINGCSACVDAGATSATKAGVSPEKLLTLAAWYEDPRFDESTRAREVARHLGTQHTEQVVTGADMRAVLADWADLFDEPFGDSSGVPTYLGSLDPLRRPAR